MKHKIFNIEINTPNPLLLPSFGLIFVLILFFILPIQFTLLPYFGGNLLAEAQNAQPEPWNMMTVYLSSGNISLNGYKFKKIDELSKFIQTRLNADEKKRNKILLYITWKEKWGKVIDVLKEISKARINTIGLIVYGRSTVYDCLFFDIKKTSNSR